MPNVNQINYGDAFCLATCILAIARFYGHTNMTMEKMQENGWVRSDGFVNGNDGLFNRTSNIAFNINTVISELREGRPVIIRGRTRSNTSNDHFVVAVGATSANTNNLIVMEPWC